MRHLKRVPYIEQMQQTESGICCIGMILRYYKCHESLGMIRDYLDIGRDGLLMEHMVAYLNNKKMEVSTTPLTHAELIMVKVPAIVKIKSEEYLVLEKFNSKWVYLISPEFGRIKQSTDDFFHGNQGTIISAVPSLEFECVKNKHWIWGSMLHRLGQRRGVFLKTAIVSLVTYGIQLFLPILIESMINLTVDPNNMMQVKNSIYFILATIFILGIMSFYRQQNVLELQIEIDKSITKDTFHKLMRLPYKYFESRANGDLLFRLNSLSIIRDLVSQHIINGLIQMGYAIVIVSYLFNKSPLLAAVSSGVFILNGLFVLLIRPSILQANQNMIIENTKLQSIQTESVYSMYGIKASGMESDVSDNWEAQYKKSMKKYKYKNTMLNVYMTTISVIQIMGPFTVLLIGLQLVASKSLNLGSAIASYTLSSIFISTSISLFNMWNDFNLASSYLERINDITEAREEITPDKPITFNLTGNVEFKNVSFAYANNSKSVLHNINLQINRGDKIAVVGSSGSGKSTLIKLLLGLYEPTSGDVLFDGISIKDIEKTELRKQIGVVPQDMNLFNKTILKNITLKDDSLVDASVIFAAQTAQIHSEIEEMPMKYNTLVSDMGLNLSGGQRQRIALARALVKRPKLIILDEATSALDSVNEKRVSDYFKDIGCTRIVVAHRITTIMDSDMIVVLDKGRIVETGTHEELMKDAQIYIDLNNSMSNEDEKIA